MSDMRSFIKVEHSRFTLILRKGMLPFHWIAESHVFPDKGYVTAVRERANYGAVWALSGMGALDQVMPSIWEDIKWLDKRRWALSIETESFDLTFGSIHYAGTRLTIPIDDDEYMVYRVEIANHRRGSSSLVTFHLDRDDSRPEHKTVGQSASAYLSVDEAKQIMQALQQAIKEADDE